MKLLYRGKNVIDRGLIYGLFSSDAKLNAYRIGVSKRDNIPIDELEVIDIRIDPTFHETPPEIIDNSRAKG